MLFHYNNTSCTRTSTFLIHFISKSSINGFIFHPEINPLNAELNPICRLLALLGGATIVVLSRLRVKYT